MCGISGFNWPDDKLVRKMMDAMSNRGPDDSGFFVDDSVSFGHVRLSILDISQAGHQPMFSDDKDLTIVYNGEIYNSPEIRSYLKNKGFTFNSSSDTEVILNSYRYWGEDCLKRFRGMFAFAIYVPSSKKIFLARDHAGIKPLYYFKSGSRFLFSSTINAIFSFTIEKVPNKKAIRDFLIYNTTDHLDETFFKGVMKFPKAHYAVFDLSTQKLEFFKWWDNDFSGSFSGSYTQAVRKLRYLMIKSVNKHLLSDVSVGTSLSGGIDSSSISLLISKSGKSEIDTFSAVFPNFEKDESKFINMLCDKHGLINHKIELDSTSIAADISDFIKFNEEPLPTPSPFAQYKVFELAKKNRVTVILDGQGADELLAGYPYFYGFLIKGLVLKGKFFKALREILQLIKGGSFTIGLSSIFFLMLPLSLQKDYFESRTCASYDLIQDKEIETSFFSRYYSCNSLHESLKFHLDYKLEHLLKWGDRNSMAHSREGRVPFLDPDLMSFIFTLPEEYILSGGKTKFVLRDAMKGILPDFISNRRDKIGFATPENAWLRAPSMRPQIDKFLVSEPRCNKYINLKKVRALIKKLFKGDITHTREIWKIIILENWMESNNFQS